MKRLYYIVLSIFMMSIIACSEPDHASKLDNRSLQDNTEWPIVLVGTLDIVEGGGAGEYLTWAVGSFSSQSKYGEISIFLDGNAAVEGRVDLDAEEEFKVWLDMPRTEYGHIEYEIIKIEPLH